MPFLIRKKNNMKLSLVTKTCFLALISCSLLACGQGKKNEQETKTEVVENGLIAAGQLERLMLDSPQLIDVRTPEEYEEGHIQGAVNINFYDDSFETQLNALDKQTKIIVYCAVGGRSGKSYKKVQALGFANAYDLKGGIKAWVKSGRSVVK